MSRLTLVCLLAVVWALLLGEPGVRNLVVGLGLGVLIVRLFPRAVGARAAPRGAPDLRATLRRGAGWLAFLGFFLRELTVANVQVALLALRPRPRLNPMIVEVPLRLRGEGLLTLLSASITLMPGTVTVGLSRDRHTLYAHAIGTADAEAARASIVRVEGYLLALDTPLPFPPTGGPA
ncbi:Na+/H+ antiporter subunit E [Deinococcus sp. MIMF12]|uniref:Na+/H+ antiporter subunit E n=1 Tax=Deinococcus rhizophilus TaxID=3049544 RepID=A0ABT7JHK4_9DEIO|nr:Na+/H+ antiporter subunit E [Deinococcus rhizophilus]MDL2343433.1 Na+/H+ antiporter subunit E [Deinococcus rhizophilus]